MSEHARLVQSNDTAHPWQLESGDPDSPSADLTIAEAVAWISVFNADGAGVSTPLQVVQQSIAALVDAAPSSDARGSLRNLLAGAADSSSQLKSLVPDAGQQHQDVAGLVDVATRLFFARERARADRREVIAGSLTELLSVLRGAADS